MGIWYLVFSTWLEGCTRNYRDLEVWKISHKLTLELYAASKKFPKDEMFGLTSQLRRAAVSIGANLAEGCGRRTSLEFAVHSDFDGLSK